MRLPKPLALMPPLLQRRLDLPNASGSAVALRRLPWSGCLQACSTAVLDSPVCRVHKFESFRSALRTGICQRQIEVGAFVSGAEATISVLPPISFTPQQGTLHRVTSARAKLMPSVAADQPHLGALDLCSVLAKNGKRTSTISQDTFVELWATQKWPATRGDEVAERHVAHGSVRHIDALDE